MMKLYLKRALAVAIICVLLFSGCTNQQEVIDESGNPVTNPNVAPTTTINDYKLRDLDALYAGDDDLSVVTMYLTVSRGNSASNTNYSWADINSHSVYYYDELGIDKYSVEGMLQVGDASGPTPGEFGYGAVVPNSTVRIRGKSSSRSAQKSYRITLNSSAGTWRSQKIINLNKHVYDAIRFRNKMCYDLMKDIPDMMSCRTQFVHLYVKDKTGAGGENALFEDYGLFTQVEQINKTYLRNHGLDEFGHLYKAEMFEFYRYEGEIENADHPDYDQSKFEYRLIPKGNEDHTKLINMLTDLNDYTIPIEEVFAKHFDEDNYFTWLAFHMITGNRDITSQNFYLYSPQNSQKWYFISWDNDAAWSSGEDVAYKNLAGYNYELGLSNFWGSVLPQRVLKSDYYRGLLDEKISEVKNFLTEERLTSLGASYGALVKPYVYSMPDIMHAPRKENEFDYILTTISNELAFNTEMYLESLRRPLPFFVSYPEVVGEQTVFHWDPSYDFDGQSVSYTFELARDYNMQNIIMREENLPIPQATSGLLEPGQYFFKITAANEDGYTQTSMEIYEYEDLDCYGVTMFYVLDDGTIPTSY